MYIFTDLWQGILDILDVTDSAIYLECLTGKQKTKLLKFCVDADSKVEQREK